jgi:DivIVA domain-containing protein
MPLMPAAMHERHFSIPRLRPGYDQQEVEQFRGVAAHELDVLVQHNERLRGALAAAVQPGMSHNDIVLPSPPSRRLIASDIRNRQFSVTRLRPSYEVHEVDEFLGQIAAEVGRLDHENEVLQATLTEIVPARPGPASRPDPRPEDTGPLRLVPRFMDASARSGRERAKAPAEPDHQPLGSPVPADAAALVRVPVPRPVVAGALMPGDPAQIGKYKLTGRLGSGGMGSVFLGTSPGRRKVAVKILHSDLASDRQFRSRFAREVAAARQVSGFYTAPVVDADPAASPPWLVTAYVPGPSLAASVAEHGRLCPLEVHDLGAALAEGLEAIHECGLVHRDLKPSNIILAEDGPRIIDFGLARDGGATSLTSTGTLLGTFPFMSPEQINGQPVGPRSDVFALGSVLTYAATGHSPFIAAHPATILHRIQYEPPNLDGLSGALRELISWCLQKKPADRPALARIITRLTSDTA